LNLETARRAVLFADVCESTAIYESLGDSRALALVNRLFALLQQKVTAGGGAVVKTLGDGMVCQFPDADAAFSAMAAAPFRLNWSVRISSRVSNSTLIKRSTAASAMVF